MSDLKLRNLFKTAVLCCGVLAATVAVYVAFWMVDDLAVRLASPATTTAAVLATTTAVTSIAASTQNTTADDLDSYAVVSEESPTVPNSVVYYVSGPFTQQVCDNGKRSRGEGFTTLATPTWHVVNSECMVRTRIDTLLSSPNCLLLKTYGGVPGGWAYGCASNSATTATTDAPELPRMSAADARFYGIAPCVHDPCVTFPLYTIFFCADGVPCHPLHVKQFESTSANECDEMVSRLSAVSTPAGGIGWYECEPQIVSQQEIVHQ